jgi:hypothetical protein
MKSSLILITTVLAVVSTASISSAADFTLPDMVNRVKEMLADGKSKADIANYINTTVDAKLIALNRHTDDERNTLNDQEYNIRKAAFDAWSDKGDTFGADNPFSAAHWVWENGFGHCQEHAHTVFHTLIMALEDGENIGELVCGDHAYVMWGIPDGFEGYPTISDIQGWPDAYLIDPWHGKVIAAKDLGRMDWYQTKGGLKDIERLTAYPYKSYKRMYDKWLNDCHDLAGNYGIESDKLIVTKVVGQSAIEVGRSQSMKPAGVFKITQEEGCMLTVKYRASEISGRIHGSIGTLRNVKEGTINSILIMKLKLKGKDKIKVTMWATSPNTGVTIVREGILTKT